MAENVLETRILLRYGTYTQWMNSDVILKIGEAAVCAFPRDRVIEGLSNSKPDYAPPAIGLKIGDGTHYFHELPWVQGIAADVYTWAKSSSKPTYTAQEIQGLQNFVENLITGDTEVTIAPRIYQLVEGTGDNENKYYLRYKENNEESNWILDTSTAIDLNNLVKVVNWLGTTNLEEYPNMITRNADQIRYFLGTLSNDDVARDNYFVTAVSESNGIITVERAKPTFSNISGTAAVTQGGTGKTSFNEGEVLIGNGEGNLTTLPIADTIASNNHLVPNYLIKAYVDNATAGLTGAMHFVGEASVTITQNSSVNPRISGYDFSQAQQGDVILSEAKEFVWTGGVWRLLGDEGSYAVKGSITDVDISPDAAIQQSKIANLSDTFDSKVDKEDGKSLTSNDFTDDLKSKLDDIDDGAQVNAIEHIYVNNEEVPITSVNQIPKVVNLQIEEFDEASQQKLQSIQAGAQVNKIEKIVYDGTEITPDENKVVSIVSDPHTEHENKIEQIFINGIEWAPNAEKQVKITIDQAALNLNVLEGATVPDLAGNRYDVPQTQKKLELETIAVTGNVRDLRQTADTYIILDCGTSTTVI